MSTDPVHFTLTEDGAFMPSPFAQSRWGDDHLNGPAVVGLAARALETVADLKTSCLPGSLQTCPGRHVMSRRRSTSERSVSDDACVVRNATWYRTAAL